MHFLFPCTCTHLSVSPYYRKLFVSLQTKTRKKYERKELHRTTLARTPVGHRPQRGRHRYLPTTNYRSCAGTWYARGLTSHPHLLRAGEDCGVLQAGTFTRPRSPVVHLLHIAHKEGGIQMLSYHTRNENISLKLSNK